MAHHNFCDAMYSPGGIYYKAVEKVTDEKIPEDAQENMHRKICINLVNDTPTTYQQLLNLQSQTQMMLNNRGNITKDLVETNKIANEAVEIYNKESFVNFPQTIYEQMNKSGYHTQNHDSLYKFV